MPSENREFLTIKELVASGYGSRSTVYRDIKAHKLPAMKTHTGRVLIPRVEYEIYMRGLRTDLTV